MVFVAVALMASRCDRNPETDSGWNIGDPEISVKTEPLFLERDEIDLATIWFSAEGGGEPLSLESIAIRFTDNSAVASLEAISAWYTGVVPGVPQRTLLATLESPGKKSTLKGEVTLASGKNYFVLSFDARDDADLTGSLAVESVTLSFSNKTSREITPSPDTPVIRFGKILRGAGQDGVDTYRIPGLVTTNSGTLIAVYDNRYNNSKDLQEDIDIGMSRSTDGGQTWEPMKVIIDMGEYGGLPQQLNGAGDPCVLYDHVNGTLWVAALWMSGSAPDKMLWWASQPGMTPQETGQFILVKSTDDGLTWSEPINITEQIKDPSWQLLLQGPGCGITMSDGTLVFPAQFKADIGVKALDGGQYTCHSTIVYSRDGGETWQIGTGAKSNTTEAQVAELTDGSLMLNMRDDRNRTDKSETNGRAVAITTDLGETWTVHPSSNGALPEPNCMASLIAADITVDGQEKRVLFFSNPNNKGERTNMTVKASLDEGVSWPEKQQTELFAPAGYGYSCLTMVDDSHLGILYEGVKELCFQKIKVDELLGKN
ncbi:MAG: exo-alpha-sialidase [Bacteroidales bacterium]|nr:exo-alpha-sialidase [Bacteroidales bacterium]